MPTTLAARLLAIALAAAAAPQASAQGKPSQASQPPARAESDSERAMGTWALVVFNTQPFNFPNTGGAAPFPLTVYTVGLRHWTKDSLNAFKNWGVDLGLGLVWDRSSVTQPQTGTLTTSDGPSASGFGLHAGLPLAITHHQHATFELVPETDLIWASEKIPPDTLGGDATEYHGWSFRVGVRAGFEIYFGFIGIPELALEAGLGAAITYDSASSKVGPIERSTRAWGLNTVRGTEPWSIFTGNVAAMYHF